MSLVFDEVTLIEPREVRREQEYEEETRFCSSERRDAGRRRPETTEVS